MYFKSIYSTIVPSVEEIERCLQHMDRRVTEEINFKLEEPFSIKEIYEALKQMGLFKSPNPNGFGAGFFQDHWSSVGVEVCMGVLEFLNGGSMPSPLNHTIILSLL